MSRKKKQLPEKPPRAPALPVDQALPWLFAGTLFLSATLLFLVEPMMAKMILPLLGGTPAVWNTCMVFFQAMLLAGYAYAHASSAWLNLRHQLLLHLALIFVPLVVLLPSGLGITEDWVPPTQESPVVWLLLLLLVSVGLPFFILSATAPLLQRWFSSTGHSRAKDPYFLYAASNLGSMLALLGYPTVIEPLLPVKNEHWLSQCWLWTLGYGVIIALVVRCVWVVGKLIDRDSTDTAPAKELAVEEQTADDRPAPGILTRLRWVALAFVPSSLMLGVTTYITSDIAAIPLFWVVPLALYLLSFILVFAKWPVRLHNAVTLALPPVLLVMILTMHGALPAGIGVQIGMHLLVLFLVSLVCHGELAVNRPPARYLTGFYLWLSLGGVLGGLFNALVAPAVFFGIAEYQIGLVFACLLLPIRHAETPLWLARHLPRRLALPAGILSDLVLALFVGFLSYKLLQLFAIQDAGYAWLTNLREVLRTKFFLRLGQMLNLRPVEAGALFLFGLPLVVCYILSARPLRFLQGLAQRLRQPAAQTHFLALKRGESGRAAPGTARAPLLPCLFVRRPLVFGLGLGLFMLNYTFWHYVGSNEPILEQRRNFYGVLKVSTAPEGGKPLLRLTNGTTSHGVQWYHREPQAMVPYFAPALGDLAVAAPAVGDLPTASLMLALRYQIWAELDREPLSYYHPTGPIGQVFAEFHGPKAKHDIAAIGLGAGTLASYGEPGQNFNFYDIDPAVVEIAARDFTYLKLCRANWDIIMGDARLRVKDAKERQYQLIILDAFNSDAIPVHLITREALELYLEKLSSDGLLALHISNRYLDLEPVLGNLADALHLAGLAQYDDLRHDSPKIPGKRAAHWVLLAHRKEDFGALAQDHRWRPVRRRPDVGIWTDDYSNLLGVFKWK